MTTTTTKRSVNTPVTASGKRDRSAQGKRLGLPYPHVSLAAAMRLLLFLNYGPATNWCRRVQGSDGVYVEVSQSSTLERRIRLWKGFTKPTLLWLVSQGLLLDVRRRGTHSAHWLVKLRPPEAHVNPPELGKPPRKKKTKKKKRAKAKTKRLAPVVAAASAPTEETPQAAEVPSAEASV